MRARMGTSRAAPAAPTLNPPAISLQAGGARHAFYALGDTPPYTYSVSNPPSPVGGTIDPASGMYTPPAASPGVPVTLRVTDAASMSGQATVTIVASLPLGIDPGIAVVEQGKSLAFSGYGGVAPYSYSVSPSVKVSINAVSGLLAAAGAAAPGSAYTVTVTAESGFEIYEKVGGGSFSRITTTNPGVTSYNRAT